MGLIDSILHRYLQILLDINVCLFINISFELQIYSRYTDHWFNMDIQMLLHTKMYCKMYIKNMSER